MGMYTEIYVRVELVQNVPDDVLNALRVMFGDGGDRDAPLPDHEFFKTDRWRLVGRCASHSFVPRAFSSLAFNDIAGCWNVISTSSLKAYDGEAVKFFDWIDSYVDMFAGEFIGYHQYEEHDKPTLVLKK